MYVTFYARTQISVPQGRADLRPGHIRAVLGTSLLDAKASLFIET